MPSGTHVHGHAEVWPHRTDFLITNGSLDGKISADEVVDVDQLVDRVDDFDPIDLTLLTRRLDDAGDPTIDQELWLYDLTNSGLDPTKAAETARANGVDASPVHALALSGHYSVMPATQPEHSMEALDVDTFSDPTQVPIAVVDSGYNPDQTPDWLVGRVQRADSKAINNLDADTWPATSGWNGHGKFVASIIVQQNPQAFVTIAALKPVLHNRFHQWIEVDDDVDEDPLFYELADEFSLLSAIRRLLDVRQDYRALNLSLGAWTHDTTWISAWATWKALRLWQSRQPGVPIVAAAGNHHPKKQIPRGDLFIPGQWEDIPGITDLYGVESRKKVGGKSEFSNPAPKNGFGRVVIGEALLGVLDDGTAAHWSGTSFATAVVSAETAKSNPPTVPPTTNLKKSLDDHLGNAPIFPPGLG